jgi:hypothetical protein
MEKSSVKLSFGQNGKRGDMLCLIGGRRNNDILRVPLEVLESVVLCFDSVGSSVGETVVSEDFEDPVR